MNLGRSRVARGVPTTDELALSVDDLLAMRSRDPLAYADLADRAIEADHFSEHAMLTKGLEMRAAQKRKAAAHAAVGHAQDAIWFPRRRTVAAEQRESQADAEFAEAFDDYHVTREAHLPLRRLANDVRWAAANPDATAGHLTEPPRT